MKKLIFVSLVLILSACSSNAPIATQPPVDATPAPVVAVEPTNTQAPLPTETSAPAPTEAPAVDAVSLGAPFVSSSRSGDVLYFHCEPSSITFEVTVDDPTVASVYFFFQLTDKATGLQGSWSSGAKMLPTGTGSYTFTLLATAIPDTSRYDTAWLTYQFVGVNSLEQNVARSEHVVQQVSFAINCP